MGPELTDFVLLCHIFSVQFRHFKRGGIMITITLMTASKHYFQYQSVKEIRIRIKEEKRNWFMTWWWINSNHKIGIIEFSTIRHLLPLIPRLFALRSRSVIDRLNSNAWNYLKKYIVRSFLIISSCCQQYLPLDFFVLKSIILCHLLIA